MRIFPMLGAIVLALVISGCRQAENVDQLVKKGELSKASEIIDFKLRNKNGIPAQEIKRLQSVLADIHAVRKEYTLSRDAVFQKLKAEIPDVSDVDMKEWENDYGLEYYLIDGEKKYYANCVFDLFLLNQGAARRAKISEDKDNAAAVNPLETIVSFENGSPVSKKICVGFSFFQEIGNLPDQTLLKAWIPYVRENRFQSNIRIARSSVDPFLLPHRDALTSMIYFEKVMDQKTNSNSEWRNYFAKPSPAWMKPMKDPASISDSAFVCQFIYEFEAEGYYRKVNPADIQPFKTSDRDYQKYTEETESRLFTPYLKKLAKEIVGQEANNYLKAKKIYEWICRNIVWTDPKPVLGDEAEYTAKYKRGDCGAKSNLFISLCRINGIPARPQGGWLVRPERNHAQHSWAQVYFEPYGWLPVDATMGAHLINHEDERVRYFYFGNCTPYHLIIYDDEEELRPHKVFDLIYGGGAQLGAFEWKGGDIEPYIRIDSHVEDTKPVLTKKKP